VSHAQPATAPQTCDECGDTLEAACTPSQPRRCCVGGPLGPEIITRRLEMAGATLMAMRVKSVFPDKFRSSMPDVLHDAREAYGWTNADVRPAIPSVGDVTRMYIAHGWLALIPDDRHVIRRIVASRSLVYPISQRHVIPWRRIAEIVHADPTTVRIWHAKGIEIIVRSLKNG
jgi:Domain of unknown function (DUF6362)